MHLLTRAEAPDWFEPTGFYCHNESGNIFSHLLPGLILAWRGLQVGFDLSHPDEAVVALHLVSAVLCLSLSALYHTGLNHSPPVAHRWLRLDYGGILALILGNLLSGVHFGFYCDPVLKMRYWSLVGSMGGISLESET
ncbi:hemolysin-III family protein [Penicillium maclennaniae]|uniref:hemolysin-III family protein n=1 Tax=Penicillium maclennaniae TaxID=1343394 RepID=UPI002540F22A|nr:hemolysin-III family protein [Penicillium maclennaniae]KAJ5670711.1 hemolysin-III family protein [Penicillium maclennaniae]